MISSKTNSQNSQVDEMFSVGAHFGYDRSRRHPSTSPYIFGKKNNIEIFDLEKVDTKLNEALDFIKQIGSEGKQILFVSGKNEAIKIVREGAKLTCLMLQDDGSRYFTNFDHPKKNFILPDLVSQNQKVTGKIQKREHRLSKKNNF